MFRRAFSTTRAAYSAQNVIHRKTVNDLMASYVKKKPISVITAHDYITGAFAEDSQVDSVLIGDSLAMVALGYEDTNELSLDEFMYHVKAVSRAVKSKFLIADLPFGSYECSVAQGVETSIKLIGQGKVQAVKLEGCQEHLPLIQRLVEIGIPVVGHLGLTPQKYHSLGGYKVQGTSYLNALDIYKQSLILQKAGCVSIVLECIPHKIAQVITEKLRIPTIGIGAGPHTSGQVLVQGDLLGMLDRSPAKFVKNYGNFHSAAVEALNRYKEDLDRSEFPVIDKHTFKIKENEFASFLEGCEEVEKDFI